MNYKIGKAVGINTDQRAALSISAQGEDGNLFLGILQLECDDAFTRGRQLLSEVADEFFDSSESHVQKLTKAGETLSQKLEDSKNLTFLLAGFSGKALYLISKGEVLSYLRRSGSTSPLTLNPGQVISGFLEPGDRVLLLTKMLSDLLGNDLNKFLSLPLPQWEEEITQKLAGSDDPAQAGLILDIEATEEQSLGSSEDNSSEEPMSNIGISPLPTISFSVFKSIPTNFAKLAKIFPKSGRGKLILAVILILALGLGVGYQFKTKKDAEKLNQFNELFDMAKGDFDASKGLASLDPPAAKDKLGKAKDELSKALVIKPGDQPALDLIKQIDDSAGSILQQFAVSKLPVFLDLGLVKDGFQATQMSLSSGNLLLLDTNSKSLISVDMNKKSNQVLAGKDGLGDGKLASINSDSAFVYSADKGIVKVGIDKKATVVAKTDSDWGKITDLAGFAGNVYAIDSLKNQIWKYLVTSNGYGDKRNYLNDGVKADFAGVLRMQIESSIYILKQGGVILRYTRGSSDNFSIGGLDKGIKDPKSIFVSSDTDNFYILDSGNSRLVVTTKTGAYKQQYQAPEFGVATDLVVDEKAKKVYLLLDGKIYSSDLK